MQLIDNFVHKSKPPEQTLYRTYLFLYFTSTERDKKKYSLGASSRYSKEVDVQLTAAYLKLILKVLASAKNLERGLETFSTPELCSRALLFLRMKGLGSRLEKEVLPYCHHLVIPL